MKRLLTLILSLAALTLMAQSARAEGFVLSDFGARGTALAGGMVGRADDPSAVAWNPAGITQLPGTRTLAGLTIVQPAGQVDSTVNGRTISTDVDKHTWVNPHAYLTHQYSDNIWFGLGIFSRFGLGNSYPDNWPGHYNLEYVSLQTLSFNPNIAFKVTDKLSLALGIELMQARMLMKKDMPIPTPFGSIDQQNRLDGKSIGLGANIAAHYTFNDQWAAGLTYRTGVRQHVEGRSRFSRTSQLDSDLYGNLSLPDQITAGVTWRPTPDLSLEAGAVYTVWSQYRSLNIHLQQPLNTVALSPKNWRDTWAFNISGEYRVNDWFTVRGGYIYETSCMNDATVDYMTPSNGRHRFTTGVGFNWDNWTLDLAYAYLIIKPLGYGESALQTPGVVAGRSHSGKTHIAAMSIGYKF